MVSDTEPRYRLVDSNGNIVGTLFAESDGTLKLQEGTSGSDNEVSVATDGTFTAPTVSTGRISIDDSGSVDHGVVMAGEASTISVSFEEPFDSPPAVIHTAGTTTTDFLEVTVYARDVGINGFESVAKNNDETDANLNYCAWLAIGQ